jgi:hypothetical protein
MVYTRVHRSVDGGRTKCSCVNVNDVLGDLDRCSGEPTKNGSFLLKLHEYLRAWQLPS